MITHGIIYAVPGSEILEYQLVDCVNTSYVVIAMAAACTVSYQNIKRSIPLCYIRH